MRPSLRKLAVLASGAGLFLACAQIAGLDDSTGSSSGTSGGSSGTSAESGVPGIPVSPQKLTLDGPCGTPVLGRQISISNNTKNPAPYALSSLERSFVFGPNATGTVAPGTTVRIDVTATPTVAQTIDSELLVEINGVVQQVPATIAGQGATFELSKPIVDFGEVRRQNGSEIVPITITNTGNAPLDLKGMTGVGQVADFSLSPTTAAVAPKGTATVNATLVTGLVTTTSAKYTPTFGGPMCGPIPILELRGKRVNTDVTVSTVDFESVGCNITNLGDRNAIVSNYGPGQVQITAGLPAGTPFSLVSPIGQTALTGSTDGGNTPKTLPIRIHFTPGQIPGDKATTLTVAVQGQADRPAAVKGTTVGLILTITPNAQTFSSDGGSEDSRNFNVTNSGNLAFFFPSYAAPSNNGGFSVSGTGTIFIGVGSSANVKFKAGAVAPSTGNLVISPASSVCSQTLVTLTGNKL